MVIANVNFLWPNSGPMKSIPLLLALTASAGVAPCKFVAKIASDLRKPDGLMIVRTEDVTTILDPLPDFNPGRWLR
jgi:nucleotidyltransferase/DNA polymerase involved in DNA repair